ncbi:RxLR effector protein [Phytophthora megakarya]|uniref:RxLR effector protein n=1 Tax=Phytophthora megakarya TaxID=4795 RepID=A0A225WAU2_9STRA|nr:RxLR effector protein [Phytophthora megakarya]
MRLSYTLLLVAATTLLAGGSMATVSDNPAEVSTMTSPDLVATGPSVGEKRSLRYLTNAEEEELNDDEEERQNGANRFTAEKMAKMAEGTKQYKRFARWARDYKPINLPDVVQGKLRYKYRYWYYHVREA